MDRPVTSATRSIGDNERYEESCEPNRNSKEQRFDMSVAEGIDDRGKEVLESLREERQMLEQKKYVDAIVFECKSKTCEERNVVRVVGFFCIVYKAPFSEGSFFVCEPL